MFDRFQKYLADKLLLTEEDYMLIESVSTIKHLRRRQYLLQEGQVWKYNCFVCKGLIRTYHVDERGQEHIINFSPENHWSGDRESLILEKPSKYNIDAIEESDVLLIKIEDFDMICKTIPSFNDLMNVILQRRFVVLEERIQATITYSAERRYGFFMSKFTAIANRVPLHMVASYLGISPETISRIRKQPTKK
jgi:CRP-like cAMP-binding protein